MSRTSSVGKAEKLQNRTSRTDARISKIKVLAQTIIRGRWHVISRTVRSARGEGLGDGICQVTDEVHGADLF